MPTKKPPAAPKPATGTPSAATGVDLLVERLAACDGVVDVKRPQARVLVARVRTQQLEVPLFVTLPEQGSGGLVTFDLYPFRFVPVDAESVQWLPLVRAAGESLAQLRLEPVEGREVLVYGFYLPTRALDAAGIASAVGTLVTFAEGVYDTALAATGLAESLPT